jgi:lactoylglutathione lyase
LAFTVEDIEAAINYFKQKGIEFASETPNPAIDGGKTVFFYGPDREYLQLVEPGKDRI